MNNVEPISPNDIPAAKSEIIPSFVIEVFNELIAKSFTNGKATVKQKDIKSEILKRTEWPFDYEWLNVEEIYREKGWEVKYDKPGWNEDYDAYFVFKAKKG